MNPIDVGRSYDTITHFWSSPAHALNGLPEHERAIRFVKSVGAALDVGCGCNGRFIDLLIFHGFSVEGVDVSEKMIDQARERHPNVPFHHADICHWPLPRKYDFITAWDSIWHVPLANQEDVLRKLCEGLNPGGILIFTMGGTDERNEIRDTHMGPPMYTATMGILKTIDLLTRSGCVLRHMEFDQYPELHMYVIVQKR